MTKARLTSGGEPREQTERPSRTGPGRDSLVTGIEAQKKPP